MIGNLANLVNRTLTFVDRFFEGRLPEAPKTNDASQTFRRQVEQAEGGVLEALERIELRDALRRIFALSSIGNKRFQDEEPWKRVKEDRAATAELLRDLLYLIRDLAVLIHPFLPDTAARICSFLGIEGTDTAQLGTYCGIGKVDKPELLFRRLEDEQIESFKKKFSGGQAVSADSQIHEKFLSRVSLKVARIVEVEKHPKADKLYIETVELGGETRRIVSGLVPYYEPGQLQGRNVLLVTNLKPAKLRGVESQGMLLAADDGQTVEVLFADHAEPGEVVGLTGLSAPSASEEEQIDIDEFFSIPISVREGRVLIEEIALQCAGKDITTENVKTGEVR